MYYLRNKSIKVENGSFNKSDPKNCFRDLGNLFGKECVFECSMDCYGGEFSGRFPREF